MSPRIVDLRGKILPSIGDPIWDGNFVSGRPPSGRRSIGGSNFGNKSYPGYNHWNNFEAFNVNDAAENIGYSCNISNFVKVANDKYHSGTKSLKCVYPIVSSGQGTFPEVAKTVTNPGDTLYYACWMYWEKLTNNLPMGVFKLFRGGAGDQYSGSPKFYTSHQSTSAGVLNSIDSGIRVSGGYIGANLAESGNTGALPSPMVPAKNGWHFCEFLCRQSTNDTSADGFYETWCDGKRVTNLRNKNTKGSGELSAMITSFITMLDGLDGNLGDVVTVWIDEDYSDNTGCRVITTNNATYASSTQFALQPTFTWVNGELIVDMNQGNIAVGDTVYDHVFNHAGTEFITSAGFPMPDATA